jgi:hypothetical protein
METAQENLALGMMLALDEALDLSRLLILPEGSMESGRGKALAQDSTASEPDAHLISLLPC